MKDIERYLRSSIYTASMVCARNSSEGHMSAILSHHCRLWRGSPKSRDPSLQKIRNLMKPSCRVDDDSQRTLIMGEVDEPLPALQDEDEDERLYGGPSDAESSSTDISARRVWNEKHLKVAWPCLLIGFVCCSTVRLCFRSLEFFLPSCSCSGECGRVREG